MKNFGCDNCKANYGITNGEWLKLSLDNGLIAEIYRKFEFRCACGYFVKWRESKNLLRKTPK